MYIIVLTALFVIGGWLLYSERGLIQLGIASYKWPKTEGKVIDSRDNSFAIEGVDGRFGVRPIQYRERAYYYEYTVDTHIYHSHSYCFGGWIDHAMAFYHIGTRVTVYYDPRYPKVAVLKRGPQLGPLFGLFFIGAALIWGIVGLLI